MDLSKLVSDMSDPSMAVKPTSPQYPHYRDEFLTPFSGQWGQAAINLWVSMNPSVNWANKQAEQWRGLPFGPYLHASRPRRARALTGPLDKSGASLWQKLHILSAAEPAQQTHDQAQCSFFMRLPIDIRVIIYEMVLGNRTFHLSAGNPYSPIRHQECKVPNRMDEQIHGQCHDFSRPISSRSSEDQHSPDVATGLLPLLCTCRRVYSEAIHTLYNSNVFEFTQNFAAFRFLNLTIPLARLREIRHLRIMMRIPRHPDVNGNSHRDWCDLWRFFGDEMTSLKHLHLRLAMLEPMEQRIRDTADSAGTDWIGPMVSMATTAHRKRACKVEIVTGQASVVTDIVKVYKQVVLEHQGLDHESIMSLVNAKVHERIRFSMGGLG